MLRKHGYKGQEEEFKILSLNVKVSLKHPKLGKPPSWMMPEVPTKKEEPLDVFTLNNEKLL